MRTVFKYLYATLFILTVISCSAHSLETVKMNIGETSLMVEVADTHEDRVQGLMNRKELDYGKGMLFVFEKEQKMSFWMKDTSIPLSIAYISKSGVIREIHDLKPFSLSPVYSEHSVLYALEVNQGWFEDQGVSVGDSIQFSP